MKDFKRKFTIYFIASAIMMAVFYLSPFLYEYERWKVTVGYLLSSAILGIFLNIIYFNLKK